MFSPDGRWLAWNAGPNLDATHVYVRPYPGNGGSLQGWIDAGIMASLAQQHRVIAFDARGHGKSGKPHDPGVYGRDMGLDIIRLLDHLGIRRAHIIGYSMGASNIAQLLTLHPERFLTATLGGAPGRWRWSAEESARIEQEASEKEKECVSRTQIFRLAPTNQPKPSDEEIRRRSAECMANTSQDRVALAAVRTFLSSTPTTGSR